MKGKGFLINMTIFGICLVIIRVIALGTPGYLFLFWNLFLASIPLIVTWNLNTLKNRPVSNWKFWLFTGIWLLFLPNAPYLVTDLLHLSYSSHRLIWFDTIVIFSFALTGLIFTLISLQMMSDILRRKFGKNIERILISISIFASGFGVYLGRYQRFNSWDIIHRPGNLFLEVADRFVHPFDHPRTWAMTIIVGVFLHILYFGWKELVNYGNTPTRNPSMN